MGKNEFVIREPKVPWTNRIIFLFIFSSFFILVVSIFKSSIVDTLAFTDFSYAIILLIWLFLILVVFILPIISRHYIPLDFSNRKIKHSYSVGAFHYNEKWQNLKDLNYISVFHTENGYEVNLWYKKNKILNLFALEDYTKVFQKAFLFSEKLNIDLLDARKRGYHKWVNKVIYKETSKIEYLD